MYIVTKDFVLSSKTADHILLGWYSARWTLHLTHTNHCISQTIPLCNDFTKPVEDMSSTETHMWSTCSSNLTSVSKCSYQCKLYNYNSLILCKMHSNQQQYTYCKVNQHIKFVNESACVQLYRLSVYIQGAKVKVAVLLCIIKDN
jgi:hypothetical protein